MVSNVTIQHSSCNIRTNKQRNELINLFPLLLFSLSFSTVIYILGPIYLERMGWEKLGMKEKLLHFKVLSKETGTMNLFHWITVNQVYLQGSSCMRECWDISHWKSNLVSDISAKGDKDVNSNLPFWITFGHMSSEILCVCSIGLRGLIANLF